MSKKAFFIVLIIALTLTGLALWRIKGCAVAFPDFSLGGGGPASKLANEAKELEAKNALSEAGDIYRRLINEYPNSSDVMKWQKKLEEITLRLLFSPVITSKSLLYQIQPGDTLVKIAKQFKTTVEMIKRANNLTTDTIVPGQKIKVWNAPFSIFVDKSQNTLLLKSDEEIVKTYIVSTGKNNCTPVGTFKIVVKQIDPPWFKTEANGTTKVIPPGSPENALGSRWMGFDLPKYGIHGTIEPQELGKQVTEGCVRLSNPDVEELYMIVPAGTEVAIVD